MQLLLPLLLLPLVAAFRPLLSNNARVSITALQGARNRAWAKGDLSDKDIFEDDVSSSGNDDVDLHLCMLDFDFW